MHGRHGLCEHLVMKARNAGTPQPAPWPTTIRGDANDRDTGLDGLFTFDPFRSVVSSFNLELCCLKISASSPSAPGFPQGAKLGWQHSGLKKLPPGVLVDGKDHAEMLRIKALWRLNCCTLAVCGVRTGRPGVCSALGDCRRGTRNDRRAQSAGFHPRGALGRSRTSLDDTAPAGVLPLGGGTKLYVLYPLVLATACSACAPCLTLTARPTTSTSSSI